MWEDNVVMLYRANVSTGAACGSNVERYNRIDELMYASFTSLTEAMKDATDVDESGLPLKLIPPNALVYLNCAELAAYLIAVYVAKMPIIEVPDLPNAMHVTQAVKDKIQRDSTKYNWALEMIRIIQNAVVYNSGAAEVRLSAQKDNIIKSVNPYNFFYDDSVLPSAIGDDARFAGYTDLVTLPTLYRILGAVQPDFVTSVGKKLIANVDTLENLSVLRHFTQGFAGSYRQSGLERILAGYSQRHDERGGAPVNIGGFFNTDWSVELEDKPTFDTMEERLFARNQMARGQHELTTYYHRGMPSWLGLPAKTYGSYKDLDGVLPVWKITLLNHTYLLAVEPVIERHGQIPLMMGQVTVDNTAAPLAFSESLAPTQVYGAKLNNARVAALRRALSDRGLYNDALVDSGKVANRSATAQIPVNGHALQEMGWRMSDAYMHLPFDPSGVGQLIGALGEVDSYAARISGNNPQMQGSHLPGNRTAAEAARVNTMGEGRFRVYSIILQQTFMSKLKSVLRSNFKDSTGVLTYFDPATRTKKSITPQEYADNESDFVLSDGLMPSNKMISPEAVASLITAIIQIPELRGIKDLGAMITLLATSSGIEDFARIPAPTPEQLAAQQQAAMMGQQATQKPSTPTQTDKQA